MVRGDMPDGGGPAGLPVRVYRDEWGIPHVRAQSVHDAFFGQGYVHALDRFWQMDASRKQMEGRWAEWTGPAGVEADRLARKLRAAAASVRDYEALGQEARAMVDAYTAGVNACLKAQPPPAEYELLGCEPEPWQGWHCVAAMRQRGYLMGSLWHKLFRASAVGIIPDEDLASLRADDANGLLCIPPGAGYQEWRASLADLREPVRALSLLAASSDVDGGSNNWALAPGRTATGRPLLAGDPHRTFELPGMYAQLQLGCDEFDVIGLTIPGVPGFPHFGHNAHVAWCVTHANADIHDLYVEQFGQHDPSRYLHRGEWLQAAVTTEEIKVRGGATVPVEITETIHGPVIAGDPARGAALTLKSVQFFGTDRSLDCLLPMMQAGSVDTLFLAVRGFGIVDHNLVAADTGGHIGHLVRAVVPRRPAVNGWLPVPGWTGDYEWDGMIPAEQMPRADDPDRGFLVTANNRVVTTIPGTGDYFCTDAVPPHRARRIEELVRGLGPATPQDMAAIHRDDLSGPGQVFRSAVARVAPASAGAAAVRDTILSWDSRMAPDSPGAACYSRLRWALAAIVARTSGLTSPGPLTNLMTQVPAAGTASAHLWWVLPALLAADDRSLTGGSSWPELLAEALELVAAAGRADVPWQQLHHAALVHPLTASFRDAAASLSPAGAALGGDNDTVWATGCREPSGMAAAYGSIARYVFDVGNWENSSWIVLAGTSGDPASPHYLDQHEPWSRCELIPMRYDWDAIEAGCLLQTLQ
jgi:penicillin amidase